MWFTRLIPPLKDRSFFLFGPRGVGKSSWLKDNFPDALLIDLLHSETFLKLSHNPSVLESMIAEHPKTKWVILDEVQKIPSLLNEVHRLIENKKIKFILTGSSARQLRRGGANLLAGRALVYHMDSLSFAELGNTFDLQRVLNWGSMPLTYTHPDTKIETLASYVHTYLKEEIQAESLVRNVEPFVRFLQIAGILNGQELNLSNISREAMVKRPIVETYVSILEDTLLAYRLPAYRPQIKVRESASPKLFWFDAGVARAAAGLLHDDVDPTWLGSSLESFIYHELRIYNHIFQKNRTIAYYRASNNVEVDFIIETKKRQRSTQPEIICLEVKLANHWKPEWSRHMLNLSETKGIRVKAMYGLYTGKEHLSQNGVETLPVEMFLKKLFSGEIF